MWRRLDWAPSRSRRSTPSSRSRCMTAPRTAASAVPVPGDLDAARDAHRRPCGRRPDRHRGHDPEPAGATGAHQPGPAPVRPAPVDGRHHLGAGARGRAQYPDARPGLRAPRAGRGALRTAAHRLDPRRPRTRLALGEWKVVAVPGQRPSAGAAEHRGSLPGRPRQLVDPQSGDEKFWYAWLDEVHGTPDLECWTAATG